MSDQHVMTYRLNGTTGIDSWIELISKRWLVRRLAKKIMQGVWHGANPTTTRLLLETPWGTWRIIDAAGSIEPSEPDRATSMVG